MPELLTVILPTYNPDVGRLQQTLGALQRQSLPIGAWELIIVDNGSTNGFAANVDLSWHPNAKIVTEPKQGLTYARINGFSEALGQLIVMVDDDNILAADYLATAVTFAQQQPKVGAFGGKSVPLFETAPPDWLPEFYGSLALRDLGDTIQTAAWAQTYPTCAPIGAGMVIRREALASYISKIQSHKNSITDRTHNSLTSGGDNDMVLEILKAGWQVAYLPALSLQHIIPAGRMQTAYLARLNNHSGKSWVQLLEQHGINPWAKIPRRTLPLRKLKAWFSARAWKGPVNYIKWQGACGLLNGLVQTTRK